MRRHRAVMNGGTRPTWWGRSDLPLASCSLIPWQEQCWDVPWGKGCKHRGNFSGSGSPRTQAPERQGGVLEEQQLSTFSQHYKTFPETGHWAGRSHAAAPGTFRTLCWIACFSSQADELFSLTVNIKVSSFSSMRAAVTYTYPMYCSYSSWASREIVCEENYMEVKAFPLKVKLRPSSLPGTTTSTNSCQKFILHYVWGVIEACWYSVEGVTVDV